MAKSFKEFRKQWDDEWDDDNDMKYKDKKLQSRRDQRKRKAGERNSILDERDDITSASRK